MIRRALARIALALFALASAGCDLVQPPASTLPSAVQASPSPQRTARVGSADRPLVMASLPSHDAARVTASLKAITAGIEKATGLRWDVKVPTSYADTIEGLCSGQLDVAWLSPLAAVTAQSKNCSDPLLGSLRDDPIAARASVTYPLQVLARTGAGISSLKDLKGKKVALADRPAAPSALSFMAQIKKDIGEDPKTFFSQTVYVSDDEKAVLAVYQGQVDAAVSVVDARDRVERTFPDVKQRTARVATVGPVPNDGVSVRKTLPADVRDQIAKALIDQSKTDEGKTALKALYGIDGLDRIDPRAYDPLIEAARIMAIDLDREAAATARPLPSPTRAP